MIENENKGDLYRDFIANFSHELRTPMHGILGLVNLLGLTDLDGEQLAYLEKIKTSSAALLELLDDALDFSKIESGKLLVQEKPFSITKSMMSVYNIFIASAKLKNLVLEFDLIDDYDDQVIGDPKRLKQVISNLVSNAIKYTEQGTVTVSVRPSSNSGSKKCFIFTVTDTGDGIPKERQSLLFERFSAFSPPGTHSTGLGLAIAKSIVDLMGGSIEFESDEGKGTTFYVSLCFETLNRVENTELTEEDVSYDFKDSHILLAEDDATSAYMLEAYLTKMGSRVDLVRNGEEVIKEIDKRDFDLILMDINMPVLDGLKACSLIREKGVRSKSGEIIPIIAITAYAMKGDREKFLEIGMSDYLSKPVDLSTLGKKITKILTTTIRKESSLSLFDSTLESLMSASGLDEETSVFVIKTYIRQSYEILEEIEMAFINAQEDLLPHLIHKLKGSSGNVRMDENMTLASESEHLADKGDYDMVRSKMTLFAENIKCLERQAPE